MLLLCLFFSASKRASPQLRVILPLKYFNNGILMTSFLIRRLQLIPELLIPSLITATGKRTGIVRNHTVKMSVAYTLRIRT